VRACQPTADVSGSRLPWSLVTACAFAVSLVQRCMHLLQRSIRATGQPVSANGVLALLSEVMAMNMTGSLLVLVHLLFCVCAAAHQIMHSAHSMPGRVGPHNSAWWVDATS
jgi:fumarate reductase subunit D